jgi:hypothetical protein
MDTQPKFGWFGSPEHLRTWAYDEDIELSDQDEDLLVYAIECLSALLDCAVDESCPKGDYIIRCIDYSLRDIALKGKAGQPDELAKAMAVIESVGEKLDEDWITTLRKRLDARMEPKCIESQAEAFSIGQALLSGKGILGDIVTFDDGGAWIIERRYGSSYVEAISISKPDGGVQYLGYWMNGSGLYRPRSL